MDTLGHHIALPEKQSKGAGWLGFPIRLINEAGLLWPCFLVFEVLKTGFGTHPVGHYQKCLALYAYPNNASLANIPRLTGITSQTFILWFILMQALPVVCILEKRRRIQI